MCVYIYYLPDAPSADNYENAKIIYTFHINGEDYQITVGADGAEEMPDGFEKLFSVKQNYTDTPSSPFLCAVQYLGSSIKYEPPVTEKSTSATKSKNSTTKRKETTTASRSTRKSSSSKATTKYTPQGIPNEEEAFYEENAEEIVESYTDSPVPKSRMSTAAKALLICAAVLGITGLSLVAAAAIKKSEPSSENENSDKEDVITS